MSYVKSMGALDVPRGPITMVSTKPVSKLPRAPSGGLVLAATAGVPRGGTAPPRLPRARPRVMRKPATVLDHFNPPPLPPPIPVPLKPLAVPEAPKAAPLPSPPITITVTSSGSGGSGGSGGAAAKPNLPASAPKTEYELPYDAKLQVVPQRPDANPVTMLALAGVALVGVFLLARKR